MPLNWRFAFFLPFKWECLLKAFFSKIQKKFNFLREIVQISQKNFPRRLSAPRQPSIFFFSLSHTLSSIAFPLLSFFSSLQSLFFSAFFPFSFPHSIEFECSQAFELFVSNPELLQKAKSSEKYC